MQTTETFVVPYDDRRTRIAGYVTVLLIALLVAWIAYDRSDLVCQRAEAGAIPQCTGSSGVLFPTALAFAYAAPDTLRVTVRTKNQHRRTIVETPAGDLRGAVDNLNAASVVAAGTRFREDPAALAWEVHPRLDITRGSLIAAVVVILAMFSWQRPKRVIVDPRAAIVFVHRRRPIALERVKSARAERIYRAWSRGTLTLRMKEGEDIELVSGALESLRPIEAAINGALTAS